MMRSGTMADRSIGLVRTGVALGLAVAVSACGGRGAETGAGVMAGTPAAVALNWRTVATKADRERLRTWREAWNLGVARAQRDSAKNLVAEGMLFDADRALTGAVPPPGAYRCRVFKLGANGTAMAEFTSYPDFACRIDDQGGVSHFYKDSGAQRASGTIFHDNRARAVFLGTLQLADEGRSMDYGRDSARDLAGFVERIGERRWRMVLPYPQFESIVDVIELVPTP